MTFASSKQLRFLELRSRYPEFVYEAYTLREESDRYVIHWDFRMGPDLRFQPRLEIPFGKIINTRPSPDVLKPLVFQLGMIELISYWKAACPPLIRVEPHTLGPEAIRFWKDLYYLGLGEFRFLNGITTSFEEFLDIESKGSLIAIDDFSIDTGKYLVPIGGGKDSALSLDLLQEAGREVVPFMVNPLPAAVRTLSAAGLDPSQSVVFKRMLDPLLLKLNGHGFLNGHTPFSALLAFSTLLASSLVGTGRIALSNESSANEATVPGTDINHQYSKSLHFEHSFRDYVRNILGLSVNYFSLLRPLTELQIAALFSGRRSFHPVFRSCNAGSKQDVWCGNCPKCLFTAIILAPFLNDEEIKAIFGKDILKDTSLIPWLDELAGWSEVKPFECVGTIEEVKSALWMAASQRSGPWQPELLRYAAQHLQGFSPVLPASEPDTILSGFIPPEDLIILKSALSTMNQINL